MYAKKNSGKKILAMVLAVVLLIGVGVGGTLAWLTAQTEVVTNTFTVGEIEIDLKEYPFKDNSTTQLDEDVTKAVTSINTYKVVPGGTQPKKPFVTVKAESEDCYVYVNVVNNLVINGSVVVEYDAPTDWNVVTTVKDTNGVVSTLYRYKSIVAYSEADSDPLVVFTKVTYSDEEITKDNITQLDGKTIVLDAFAHQSANTDQDTADAAAMAHFGYTA